jgi:hypothetical protein
VPVPLLLGPLSELRNRAFAFYPAIVGVEHNEWRLRRATWTDLLILNTKTDAEVWIPRRWVGEVSSVEAPVVIVGLVKELEYKEGVLAPHHRRVIEMPRAVNGISPMPVPSRLAPVIAIRTETPASSPARRWLRGGVAAGILASIAGGFLLRDTPLGARYGVFRPALRSVRMGPDDDYASVVEKLGRPSVDQWLRTAAGTEYRRLWYSRRGVAIILTGSDRASARYAGTLNARSEVLHVGAPSLLDVVSQPALRR